LAKYDNRHNQQHEIAADGRNPRGREGYNSENPNVVNNTPTPP